MVKVILSGSITLKTHNVIKKCQEKVAILHILTPILPNNLFLEIELFCNIKLGKSLI